MLSPGSAGEVDLLTVEKILCCRGGGRGCSNFFVEEIIFLGLEEREESGESQSDLGLYKYQGTVHVEPPVTNEVLLVEDCSWVKRNVKQQLPL